MFIDIEDNNIDSLRDKYGKSLHFVVGDTHGEVETTKRLMEKIKFNPDYDHVYFLGDYNAGGNPTQLLRYISNYYQEDYNKPGFHLIRGNHEREELWPMYDLENIPDIIVIKCHNINTYLAHAGMLATAFNMINDDIENSPEQSVYAYRLADECVNFNSPLRQIIWSRKGLYYQGSVWPSEEDLKESKACIIHGHTPYVYLLRGDYVSYGKLNAFWKNQHVCFSEELQGFDIDSNIKGCVASRGSYRDTYRGLACLCLEALDDIAGNSEERIQIDKILLSDNFVFGAEYVMNSYENQPGDISKITDSMPKAKLIRIDGDGNPYICN